MTSVTDKDGEEGEEKIGRVGGCLAAHKTISEMQEFICGWGAAFINICMTFPLNKVMFRQMLSGVNSQKAVIELKQEGIYTLYRGILPPLLQKTCSASLMFGMYDQYQKVFLKAFPHMPPVLCLSVSAILAGSTEAVLTPFERIQTLLQDKTYNQQFRNSYHAIRELRAFGLREYYRGVVPILFRNGPSNVLFFGLRGEVRKVLPPSNDVFFNLLADFCSGACVGAFISTVFYPFNVVKTHMQVRLGGPFISMRQAFLEVYLQRGRSLRRIFSGVHVNYTRALLSWGIINACYELLKSTFFTDSIT